LFLRRVTLIMSCFFQFHFIAPRSTAALSNRKSAFAGTFLDGLRVQGHDKRYNGDVSSEAVLHMVMNFRIA